MQFSIKFIIWFTALFFASLLFLLYFCDNSIITFIFSFLFFLGTVLSYIVIFIESWFHIDTRFLDKFHFLSLLLALLHFSLLSKHLFIHFDFLNVTAITTSSSNNGSRSKFSWLLFLLIQIENLMDDSLPFLGSFVYVVLILFTFDNSWQLSLMNTFILYLRCINIHLFLENISYFVFEF